MNKESIDVNLTVEVSPSGLFATLVYTNNSPKKVYIEKINGCLDGVIENNVFLITNEGEKIKYVGILAKRKPPGPDDFAVIEYNDKLTTRVRLDECYNFLPGLHDYVAIYSAFHTYRDRPGFYELKSNQKIFSFSKSG